MLQTDSQKLLRQTIGKWQAIALSTERINRKKATNAINAVYKCLDFDLPEICFVDSPDYALDLIRVYMPDLGKEIFKSDQLHSWKSILARQLQPDWVNPLSDHECEQLIA